MTRTRSIGLILLLLALVGAAGFLYPKEKTETLPDKACWSSKECFVSALLSTIKTDGLDAGYRELVALYKQEPTFRPHCMAFGFALGDAIYKEYPDPARLSLTPVTVSCSYHLLQQYPQSLLLTTGDVPKAQEFCRQVAAQLGRAVPGAESECYRGIGRGLPFLQKNLWGNSEKMAASATAQCKVIAPNKDSYGTCLSAVFNIIGRSEVAGEYGLSVNKADPLLLCKKQTDQELRSRCFGNYKVTAISLVDTQDFTSATTKLEQLYGENASSSVGVAVWMLGYNWAYQHLVAEEPFSTVIQSCAALPASFTKVCIEGVSVGLAKNGTPNNQDKMLADFCKAARTAIPLLEASNCPSLQAVGYLRGFYSPAHFADMCREYKTLLGVSCDEERFTGYGY